MRYASFAFLLITCSPVIAVSQSALLPGAVSGHVYCADSHTPCRFAKVIIQSVPPAKEGNSSPTALSSHSYSAATDINGEYQIEGVVPGEYYILGQLPGYLSPYDLAASEFEKGSQQSSKALEMALIKIVVDPGQTTMSSLSLARGAALGGTIRYDDGALAIDIPVRIYRKDSNGKLVPYQNSAGDSALAPLGFSPHTDDRGHFYEPGLPPGTYTVEATLPQSNILPTTIFGRQSLRVKITTGDALRVFRGQAYRLKDAAVIELNQGEERSDIDITLPTSGLHTLRGTVAAQVDGHTISRGTIRLLDPDDKSLLRETAIQEDGTFTFNYVVSGSYLVEIEAEPEARLARRYEPLTMPIQVEGDIFNLSYSLTTVRR